MNPLPEFFQFHHVGVGVLDLEAGLTAYCSLGYRPMVVVDDTSLGVQVAFLALPQDPGHLIELLAPLGSASPLGSLIKRKLLPSPYHTCYVVHGYPAVDRALADRGFTRVSDPTPALAMPGARIAFYFHPAIGLLEIAENPPFLAGEPFSRTAAV